MAVNIIGIQPELIDAIWLKIEPILQKAIVYDYGNLTLDIVKQKLQAGDMQLWVVNQNGLVGAYTTELVDDYGQKICRGLLLSGEKLNEWVDALNDKLEWFAKQNKCVAIEFVGRKGWKKIVNRYGYRDIHTIYQKVLTDE